MTRKIGANNFFFGKSNELILEVWN